MNDSSPNRETVSCAHCEYFTVTWNPRFPRGCKLFGFQSVNFPSVEVLKASGEVCSAFVQKSGKSKDKA